MSRDVLARIDAGFVRRGVEVRAVFLMRDPVERCWSAVRMLRRDADVRRASRLGIDFDSDDDATALMRYVETTNAQIVTDYPQTIENIRAVFGERRVFIGTYETLFTEAEIARLSSFLGLSANHAFTAHRFNPTERNDELEAAVRARVARRFADVYSYVGLNHPEIAAAWATQAASPGEGPAGSQTVQG